MSNVYCVIVTYNAMKWVDKCFSSLRQSSLPINIVVVDNGSTDKTISYLHERYPEVHVIANATNKGFGQANNQGIEFAFNNGATHFFLLNQDAWIEENTVANLVEVQDRYDFAIVSPIHLNGLGDRFDFGFYEAAIERVHNIVFVSDTYLNSIREFYLAEDINAAAWLLSKSTVEHIGGFDPLFFHYGEDINYCQRIKYHGRKMAFVPSAIVYHDRAQYGNIAAYKKGETMMTLLLNHADINSELLSFSKNFKTHVLLWMKIIKNFVQLKWNTAFNYMGDICRFYFKLPNIIQSRKQNRIISHNWLDI